MPVSIREVATRAGVSLGTVSKALNNSPHAQLSQETRERVRSAATELGYHPSAVARAMTRKRFDTIGVVLPPGVISPMRIPFFSAMFDAILGAAASQQQNVTVFLSESWKDATQSLPAFRDGRCDSFLLFMQSPESDIFDALAQAELPFVLLNQTNESPVVRCVDVDDVLGAQTMTEYLIGLGHRRIAMLCGDRTAPWIQGRLQGYRQALEHAGIPYDPRLTASDSFVFETIQGQVDTLMDLPEASRPTALFCGNDTLAFQALRCLSRRGLRVPEDISLVGFDDVFESDDDHQSLTTMRQPFTQLAELAIQLVLQTDTANPVQKIRLPTTLIGRGSTATVSLQKSERGN